MSFETKDFPVHLCTIPNKREPNVKESDARFLCLLEHGQEHQMASIMVLTPYTYTDQEGTLFGWFDEHGNVWAHKENSATDDEERVIAWRQLDDGEVPDYTKLFNNFETRNFPVNLCTIPDKEDPEIKSADTSFLCALIDERFNDECRLMVLTPYTCPDVDDPNELRFGWVDEEGFFFDHKERDIHNDPLRVIAWKRLDTSEPLWLAMQSFIQ